MDDPILEKLMLHLYVGTQEPKGQKDST